MEGRRSIGGGQEAGRVTTPQLARCAAACPASPNPRERMGRPQCCLTLCQPPALSSRLLQRLQQPTAPLAAPQGGLGRAGRRPVPCALQAVQACPWACPAPLHGQPVQCGPPRRLRPSCCAHGRSARPPCAPARRRASPRLPQACRARRRSPRWRAAAWSSPAHRRSTWCAFLARRPAPPAGGRGGCARASSSAEPLPYPNPPFAAPSSPQADYESKLTWHVGPLGCLAPRPRLRARRPVALLPCLCAASPPPAASRNNPHPAPLYPSPPCTTTHESCSPTTHKSCTPTHMNPLQPYPIQAQVRHDRGVHRLGRRPALRLRHCESRRGCPGSRARGAAWAGAVPARRTGRCGAAC